MMFQTPDPSPLKFKKIHPEAVPPIKMDPGANGFDLSLTFVDYESDGRVVAHTGIALEIPFGYAGLLLPRSSIAKTGWVLANSVGLIDSSYRGEIMFAFRQLHDPQVNKVFPYFQGDRVGQILIAPSPHFELMEVNELSETSRGEGSFGSTGK